MSKAELIKAIEEEEDPIMIDAIEAFMKRRLLNPLDLATIDRLIEQDEEEIAREGTYSLEEVRKEILGKG